MNNTTTKSE